MKVVGNLIGFHLYLYECLKDLNKRMGTVNSTINVEDKQGNFPSLQKM